MTSQRREAAAIIGISGVALCVHLDLVTPWPLIAVLAIATAGAVWSRLDRAAGVGVLLTAAAFTAQLVGISPIPLAVGALVYFAFDRLRPAAARAGWFVRGRIGGSGLAMIVAVVVVASTGLVVWARIAAPARPTFDVGGAQLVLGALAFATINAAAEEVAYRGALQTSLEDTLDSKYAALVVQAVLFGAAHYHGVPNGWAGIGLATLYGALLGVVRLHRGGLLAAWIAHIFADLTIVAILVSA